MPHFKPLKFVRVTTTLLMCAMVFACASFGDSIDGKARSNAKRAEGTESGDAAEEVRKTSLACTSAAWSRPAKLFADDLRLAAGQQLYAVGTNRRSVYIRSSSDEGTTWTNPIRIPHAGTLPIYGPLATAGDNVYLLTRANGGLQIQRSADRGTTWSAPVLLHGYSADNADRVQLAAEATSLHVFVGRAGAVADSSFKVYYWRSKDSGASFDNSGIVRVLDDNTVEPPSPGGIAVENGVVHIGYAAITKTGTLGHRARYMRSTDNGATWSRPVDVGGPGSNPQIRPRPRVLDGRVFVLWEEPLDHNNGRPYPNATRSEIRTNYSLDNGRTWQGPKAITQLPDNYANHPEVAVGPRGFVHVIYRLSKTQFTLTRNDAIGYRASPDYGATWCPHEIGIQDPTRETHPFNLVSTDGYLHAASAEGIYARRSLQ